MLHIHCVALPFFLDDAYIPSSIQFYLLVLILYLTFRPRSDLEGLKGKCLIAVTFHCILPKSLWEWDEFSSIHLRFEGHALGNWSHNVGNFKQGRCVTQVQHHYMYFHYQV